MATTKTYNFQQIAAGFIASNNPKGVSDVLIASGIISAADAASLTTKDLVNKLYQYYLLNGTVKFISLLKLIPYNPNAGNWTTDPTILNPLKNDVQKIDAISGTSAFQTISTQGAPTTMDTSPSWLNWILGANSSINGSLFGSTTTTTNPVVTTTTKASAVTIGMIIAGVLVLGIIAWVAVKS